jgi:DNA-directed RNA polymerase alpha subunit
MMETEITIKRRRLIGECRGEKGWKLKEIASVFRITGTQVSQILKREEEDKEFSVQCLDLQCRAYRVLKRHDINSIAQLTAMTEAELRTLRNLGSKSAEHIKEGLRAKGWNLRPEP